MLKANTAHFISGLARESVANNTIKFASKHIMDCGSEPPGTGNPQWPNILHSSISHGGYSGLVSQFLEFNVQLTTWGHHRTAYIRVIIIQY